MAGIPDNLVPIIRSFHSRMSAIVQRGGVVTDPISVRNGLRQECTMAPFLLNIFMWRWWRGGGNGSRMRLVLVLSSGIIVRLTYHKFRCLDSFVRLTESQFADKSALFTMSREGAEQALVLFVDTAAEFGLTVNAMKTKFLVVGGGITAVDSASMNLGGVDIVCGDEFRYIGSSIHHSGRSTTYDIDARVAAASRSCGTLQKSVFAVRYLDIHIERCVCSILVPYLYYVMVRSPGPLCSVIFAVYLPFSCVVFIPIWEFLGHELGWNTSLMLSCWLCGVIGKLLKRSLPTVFWSSLDMLPEWRIAGCLGRFCLILSCSVALPTDPGRDGKMVLSRTCALVICLLLGLTWQVSPGRLGVTHIPLWLVSSFACSLLSALYVIDLLLVEVFGGEG